MTEAPRHDLIRGLAPIRAEDNGNIMVGYPIVFDQWTTINSWEGNFLERIAPSGPARVIASDRLRNSVKVQYNHGMHPVIGTSGLGKPTVIKADERGVYTETPLSDTSYNRDIIKPLLADGTLDGMSFRFSVTDEQWVDPTRASDHNPDMLPERTITEFKWHEFGPVDWPAYEATQAGIRSKAALAMWLQTPQEQRTALMSQFHIALDPERRLWAPGFEARGEAPVEVETPAEDPEELAPEEIDGPADATRQDGPPPVHPFPRAVRPPCDLAADLAEVRAMTARLR